MMCSSREVVAKIANKFNFDDDALSIHRSQPEDYMFFLLDESSVEIVLNCGMSVRKPFFRLIFKRWSRQAHSSGSSLRFLVEFELHGIPAHA